MALSLSSMIDVVFLLLAYFLITTVVTQREDRLTPNLQLERDASGGETQDFEPQVVEVLRVASLASADGVFLLSARPRDPNCRACACGRRERSFFCV